MYTVNKTETFRPAYRRRHIHSRILLILCLLCAINTALTSTGLAGTTYYVDPSTGSMSNNGSENSPWSTLQEVFDNGKIGNPVVGGDTIYLRDGYHGEINYTVNGNNSDYITIDADTGHTPKLKNVTLKNNSKWIWKNLTISPELAPTFSQGTTFYIENCTYITVDNCTIYSKWDSSSWNANDWNSYKGHGLYSRVSATHITFSNNYIKNVHSGIVMDGSNSLAEYNTIENFAGDGCVGNGDDQVWQYNIVMNSYNVDGNHDDLLQIAPGPNYRIEIRGNIFISGPDPGNPLLHGAQGICLWDGPNYGIIIENNIVINDHGGHGIKCYDCQDSVMINNIAVNHPHGASRPEIGIGSKGKGGNHNVTIRNNIAHGFAGDPPDVTKDHNLDVDNYNWDELFVNWSNYDLRHVVGSPAIDAGSFLLAPNIDIIRTSRPQGAGYDIGAYEFISGPPDTTPPLPPTNLIRTAQTENSISLSWTAPGPASDGDLASSYRIFRDTSLVGWGVESSFQDTGLAADTSYSYEVYSVDDAGNQSTSAATGTFSTLADTTPPVISNAQASNVTASQATITWDTDEASTSQVEYGLNTNYGNSTGLNANLVTSHSVLLTGLASETLYHYHVRSKDASGNESISQNNTFTTISAKCSLTVSSTIGGSVTTPGEPGPYLYDQGTEVSIEATEDPNYRFVNWTGTAVNAGKVANPDSASTTVTIDTDYTIQANFVIDETDKTAPTVTNLSPQAGSIQAPLNTLVTLSITDSGDGVDADSVTIKVNNDTVYSGNTAKYSSAYGECYRTGTKADYTFIYQSNESFDFDQPISVTVNATDLAGNAMAEYSYSFTTEMRSFGENKKVGSDNLNKSSAVTVRDSNGDIWAAWQAGATGSRDIYIGKLAAGAANFNNGIKVKDNSTDQCNPAMAVGSDDKLYVAWQDNRGGNWDIYVSTSSDGINFSTETRVTDSNDNQINPVIVVDGSNNAYIVWMDDRNGNQDIYIATSSNGFVTKTVSQITLDNSNQVEPAIAADSDNTVYVVWTDTRNSKNDIYGAASNNGPWTNIPIVTTEQSQSSPTIATEVVGSILHLVWVDDTPGDDDIFYAKTSGGLPSSPLTGSSIIDDTSSTDQLRPAIAVSGSTGNSLQVFVCWEDERNADDDLYFAELGSGSGTNVFVDDDGTNTNQTEPAINIDGDGHPYLVWTDSRNTNTDIYYAGSTFIESDLLASNNISTSSTVIVGTPLNAINSVDDVSIEVPAGAYPFDIKVTISKITNPLAFTLQCLGAYDFGPSGTEFSSPVTVIIPYNFTGSEDSALAYWYNSLTDALSQQGITEVETIKVSPSLHALRFKTTHFTPFYVFLVSAGGAAASGGGGGGCSMSPDSQASAVELMLPYIGLTVAMVVLKLRDRRKRKALNITKSEC